MEAALVLAGLLLALAPAAAVAARLPGAAAAIHAAAGLLALGLAATGLGGLSGVAGTLHLPLGVPWIGAQFRLDALSAAFLLLLGLGGAAACLAGIGQSRHEAEPGRLLPFLPAFLGAMALVLLADDAFTFLLAWELMSLCSWALVMVHHREAETRRAGTVYLVMAGLGTLALLLAFGLLAGPAGAYGFDALRAAGHGPALAGTVLCLALLGCGSKAGLVPLHVWLPLAHPAAPAHVSALMSGVMTKVAVYGFLRIAFDLAGPPHWWWALPVLAAGAASAVLGVLTALMETDLKRVLAASTIENVGVIFVAIGLALAFAANGSGGAAALALVAALFHALNHAGFKTLLFLGAGAVLHAAGTRDLERQGGLLRRMPVTGTAMLAGCMAISALPPLNGFASEWLGFQAVLLSPELPQWGLKLAIPAAGGLLALAAALAAACFVRVYGIGFLGRPRSPGAAMAGETDAFTRAALVALALFCLLGGILPGAVIDLLAPVTELVAGARMPRQLAGDWLSIVPVAESRSSYNGLLLLLFMAVSGFGAAALIHRTASRAVRTGPVWDCGAPDDSPLTQYSALSFAQPVRRVFAARLLVAEERVEMPGPLETGPARFRLRLRDPGWAFLADPAVRAVRWLSGHANALQFLTIRRYLSLVFALLVALLAVLATWG